MIQFAIYTSYGGALYADYSARIQGATLASNGRGYAECTGFIPLSLQDSFLLYDRPGLPHVRFSDTSSGAIYEGRLQEVAIVGGGVHVTALGYAIAMSDAPYTALWSDTSTSQWAIDNPAGSSSQRYQIDTNNRLYIACQKGASYANAVDLGVLRYNQPYLGSRDIAGGSWDYDVTLPVNWKVELVAISETYGTPTVVWTLTASGVQQTGTVNVTWTAQDTVYFRIYNNTGGASAPAGETGVNYAKLTSVRLVTSTANRVNTTWSAPAGPVTGVQTVTPASMANIYVGQRLSIKQGGATNAESVIVTAITATTFTATFAGSHVSGETIQAHVIYADEIADDLIATISTLNPGQLSSNTALTASPGLDLLNESYEDMLPSDILDYLAGIGDTTGAQWEWGVKDSQRLYFRRQSIAARTWYIDVSELDIQRLLDQLENSIYAVYQDASGRTLRTSATADSASVARYGLTRRAALSVSSTSATQAGLQQAAALADGKDPRPQSGVAIDRVFDAAGQRWPLWSVGAGDTVIIRNLAPTLSVAIDRIRVFRLSRATYDLESDTLALEPEAPRPTLEALLARVAAGVQKQVRRR